MSDNRTCPRCGSTLPGNAPAGICPKCLMQAGLQIPQDSEGPGGSSAFAATTPQPGGFVPPAPAALAGHFPQLEILELLGQGGMGAVYKARQTKLNRFVALKIIRPESADDAAFAERFMREARTLARLSHPQIVAIHDFGEVPLTSDGTAAGNADQQPLARNSVRQVGPTLYYFVMEYIDGTNLRELMQSGGLQPPQALAIVPQICDALQYAHDEGIIHRDIKPENILIDRRGRVKIADFGLAKLAGQTPENFTLTGTHQVMGTPRYMAPEQMEGSHLVDHRADIYSLGVVFYEMLTGELPLGRFDPPSSKAAVDARLDDVVHRALAKEPSQRYQRASEIRRDVDSLVLESLSQGGAASLLGQDGLAGELPGPSTILERQVAGVVNWLRGAPGATPEAGLSPTRSAPGKLAALCNTTVWGAVACLLGIAVTCFSWALILKPDTDHGIKTFVAAGYEWAPGMVACFTLIALLFFLLSTSAVRPRPVWRSLVTFGAALTVLACALVFVHSLQSGALSAEPLLSAASWSIEDHNIRVTTVQQARGHAAISAEPGPKWLMAIAVALVGIAAVDFRTSLHPAASAARARRKSAAVGPRTSRKAIVGACWAGLFFLGAMMFVPAFVIIVPADTASTTAPTPLIYLGMLVGVSGLPAPVVTTILGWIAISDIRHSRGQLRGLGLAFTDALLFPLLLLDVAILAACLMVMKFAGQEGTIVILLNGLFWLLVLLISNWLILSRAWRAAASPVADDQAAASQKTVTPSSSVSGTGSPPLARVAFTVPESWDIGATMVFHFSELGYVLVREQPGEWVFKRGRRRAALLDTDIRAYHTVLTVRTATAPDSRLHVSCRWAVSTFGLAYVGKRDIAVLEGEGRELQSLLGGGSSEQVVAPSIRTDVAGSTSNAFGSATATPPTVDVRRIQMELRGPAGGLLIVGFLSAIFWCIGGSLLLYEGFFSSGRRADPAEIAGAVGVALLMLLTICVLVLGARKIRRLTGYEWCIAASVLAMIPWSAAVLVGLPVGIWTLRTLRRPDVREAFLQQSL